MKKLKVGIIGLGVGEKHIRAYQSHGQCELTALCDFTQDKIREMKAEYPDYRMTTDADDILEDTEIDVVSIASYDNYHYDQIVKAVKNRKHVFVEKPLCLFPTEATAIKKALDENPNIHLSSNLNLRSCPRFIRFREAVRSGEMGQVFYLEGDYLWGRVYKLTDGWRKRMPFYSMVHGSAVHMIDLLIWISGMNPSEVHGYGNKIATAYSDFKFNDFVTILMKFENGLVAKVTASGGCVHPHFHRVAVFGTKETFFNDINGGKRLVSTDPNAEIMEVTEAYPGMEEKEKVIHTFIDSILSPGKKAIVSSEDVFKTMSVCFAAERSIQEGRPIRVDYI